MKIYLNPTRMRGAGMKGLVIKLGIMLVVFVVIIPMIMPGANGKPVMSASDWMPDFNAIESKVTQWLYKIGDLFKGEDGVSVGLERPTLYKWQDEFGSWHYSDKPSDVPNRAGNVQEMSMPTVSNTMQAPPDMEFASQGSKSESKSAVPLPMTISPAKIPQLIDDAKKLQQAGEQRASQLDNL